MPFLPYYDHIDPGQGGSSMVIPEWPKPALDRPQVFACPLCHETFSSYEDRFQHRFEAHPYQRPLLVLGTHEVNTPRFVVTAALTPEQIRPVNAATCRLDGKLVSSMALARHIAEAQSGFFKVELTGAEGKIKVDYEISIEIASDAHALLVEQEFARLYSPGVISVANISAFIRATSVARTAHRYVEGLAAYLYGILAKDQRGETTLSQEQGRARLNEARQMLLEIDRPLAAVVAGIVSFQSNAFSRSERLTAVPRLWTAMRWFDSVRTSGLLVPVARLDSHAAPNSRVPLDSTTDEILTWMNLPPGGLSDHAKQIGKRSQQDDWLPEDRIKAKVLLAAIYESKGDSANAAQVARAFRHDPVFGQLAERLISAGKESSE
ncbi:hypothetical protein [Cupriavidus metallidurans]|uniref:hypothetical protein n=1 Tax=Cupriavidus metallidurans TaxID=119219 RepID=UPI001CCEFB4D|nr:hypothetical protein [Cupriavidus metallidurans]UBM09985.1 hypothetical protein LAI70_22180 [Cupriavidus metallidurans]